MPLRPTTPLRVSEFLGFDDATPTGIGDGEAQQLVNAYRKRRTLHRRGGQSSLGVAVAPDQDIQGLEWCKIGGTEHLIGVHNTNVVDYFAASVGSTVSNGTARLTGGADVNGAFIDDKLFLGNGTSQNIRYNGGVAGLATDFSGGGTDFLAAVYTGGHALYTGQDFSVSAWVYLDTLASYQAIISIWDVTTSSNQAWVVEYDNASNRFRLAVQATTGTITRATDTTVLTTGVWYHVAAKYQGSTGTVSIQVNNNTATTSIQAGTKDVREPVNINFIAGGLFQNALFGAGSSVNSPFNGRVSNLGFWRTTSGGGGFLSAAQVTALYNGGFPLPYTGLGGTLTTGLAGYWDMGESAGTRDDDSTAATTADLLPGRTGVSPSGATGTTTSAVVAQALPDRPSSTPTLVEGGTSGLTGTTAGNTYRYLVTFINADGAYTEPCVTPASTTIFANRTISVQSIPLYTAGQEATGRAIFRSDDDGPYYLVTEIHDNTTTVYVDSTADLSANITLQEANSRFPPTRYNVEHQGRMIGAHCETTEGDLKTVYVSNVDEGWYCPLVPDLTDPNQGTRVILQGRAQGEITGLCSHGGVVAVFTGGTGHLLIGDEPANFRLQKFCDNGCVAHRTIQSTRGYLFWLGPDAVYQWDGGRVEDVSDPVRATLDAMTAAEQAAAYAWVWDQKYFIGWPTGCIYYDFGYRQWGSLTNNLWTKVVTTYAVPTLLQRVYGARKSHSNVYQLETGATDAIPSPPTSITMTWQGKEWDMGLPGHDKRVHYVETRFKKGTGTATVTLKKGTGQTAQSLTHDISNVNNAAETVSRKLQGVGESARDEFFSLTVALTTTDATAELLSAGLHWTTAGNPSN